MNDDASLTDRLLDLMVYAPIGLALEAKELVPKLADRGRGQVALTRLAGRVAADRGTDDARALVGQLLDTVGSFLAGDGSGPRAGSEPHDRPPARAAGAAGSATVDRSDLPIDDYDELPAPDLLPHLEPLSNDELEDVLRYERAHRSRATVINRIRQLQA